MPSTNPTQNAPGNAPGTLAEKVRDLTLDGLVKLKRRELDELFLLAETPAPGEVVGLTDGRVLDGVIPFHKLLLWMPWKGKLFVASQMPGGKGTGRNRMDWGPFKTMMFPFETSIVDPMLGKNQVFTLDYTIPANLWPINIIRDDLKRLKEGLYLGAVFLKWTRKSAPFLVYFALRKNALERK